MLSLPKHLASMAAPFSAELFALVRGEHILAIHILCTHPREELVTTQKAQPPFGLTM
jgi:hypothetical protein